MNVSAIANATAAAQTANTTAPQTVDYQSFLKLLVAQMKNQDPTQPMDSTDYVAQLATFSQVEQSVQINSKLENMLQSSSLAQATGLIGKYVEAMDGSIEGVVKHVEIYSDGVMAVLENGGKIQVQAGIIVRDGDYTPPPETENDGTTPDEDAAA
jgi:flagellar basal-body rod modification protein FlgD